MTSFATLGLDPDDVRADLQSLGIDDTAYSDDELKSLMLVSNVALEQAIFDSADNVESLLFDYTYQADLLTSMQSTFNRLQDTIAVANAEASSLIDFLDGEDVYLDVSDASLIEIDHSWSYTDGGTTYTLEPFETLEDFLSAVANNETINYDDGSGSTTALEFGYAVGEAAGLFTGIINSAGFSANSTNFDDYFSDFIGGGDYYIQTDGDIPAFLDLDGFKQYLTAGVLQDAGYIGDDVQLDPVLFAKTDLASPFYLHSDNWAKWMQLYFGRTTIDFDADAGTITMSHTGAAALRAMGISLGDYFEDGEPDENAYVIFFKDYTDAEDELGVPFEFEELVESLPEPINTENASWLIALTASYIFDDLDVLMYDLSTADFGEIYIDLVDGEYDLQIGAPGPETHLDPRDPTVAVYQDLGYEYYENDAWSDFSSTELTALHKIQNVSSSYYTSLLSADTLDDLLEDAGTALQSQSSTGELALVEASTAITEWSELHNGWDTVHKYVTDALGRAIAMMK